MLAIFLKTLPFFLLIGTGWIAGRTRFFSAEATAWLTKFVFYFALSAMLFRFAATLDIRALFDLRFAAAYLVGCSVVWAIAYAVGRAKGASLMEAAMMAHASIIGNTGFLGVPMLVVILGPSAIGPVLMVLTLDLVVFSTVITLIIAAGRHGRLGPSALIPALRGVVSNPMVVSMVAGLAWSALKLPLPEPAAEFLTMLGAAATPGALFAIGASLAHRPMRRPAPALAISFAKLFMHPVAVGAASWAFGVDPVATGVMVAAAALPVAGNVYILAHHFGVAQERVSAAILLSTAISIATIPYVIHIIPKG